MWVNNIHISLKKLTATNISLVREGNALAGRRVVVGGYNRRKPIRPWFSSRSDKTKPRQSPWEREGEALETKASQSYVIQMQSH